MAASSGKGDRGKATKLHSLYVRQRAAFVCQRCGKTRSEGQIQCAHIISRHYGATRTNEYNAFALCASCHWYFGKWPMEFSKFVIDMIGSEGYEELRTLAENGVGKKVDWASEIDRLKAKIGELDVDSRVSSKRA